MGRPRKYENPEFEEWLQNTGRTNRPMARIYVQQVTKIGAVLDTADPSEEEVRAAVQAIGAREHHSRAAWNAYVEFAKARRSVVLPTLAGKPRTPRLTPEQTKMVLSVMEFAEYTGATLRELMTVDVASVTLYRADPEILGIDVYLTAPSRLVRVSTARDATCFTSGRCAWALVEAAVDRAYAAQSRSLRLFQIMGPEVLVPTWNDWCAFAAAAGLQTRLPGDPGVPYQHVDLNATDRDKYFWVWCQDPTMSWAAMQEKVYGVTAQEKQEAVLAREARENVDRIVGSEPKPD